MKPIKDKLQLLTINISEPSRNIITFWLDNTRYAIKKCEGCYSIMVDYINYNGDFIGYVDVFVNKKEADILTILDLLVKE